MVASLFIFIMPIISQTIALAGKFRLWVLTLKLVQTKVEKDQKGMNKSQETDTSEVFLIHQEKKSSIRSFLEGYPRWKGMFNDSKPGYLIDTLCIFSQCFYQNRSRVPHQCGWDVHVVRIWDECYIR